jgi:RNA polymerase sigma-70 factor (ECF subfamily)
MAFPPTARRKPTPGAPADDLAPTRWTLIERLKDWEDEASWREFFDTYWQLIYGVARKAGLTETEAREAAQETVISVAEKMPEFNCDPQAGSFKGFLLQVTGWRITDQFRKRGKSGLAQGVQSGASAHAGQVEGAGDGTATIDRVPDPGVPALETIWDEEWRTHLVDIAMRRLRQRLDPGQCQMFELHVVRGEPAKAVARKLGVTVAQVYFAKYKLSAAVKRELRLLKETLS